MTLLAMRCNEIMRPEVAQPPFTDSPLSRLTAIKCKYGRENFFRRNSNVPPSGKAEGGSRA
jgi:hypothetical protein